MLYLILCERIIGATGPLYASHILPFCPDYLHTLSSTRHRQNCTPVFSQCTREECDHVRNARHGQLRSCVLIPVVSKPRRRTSANSPSSSCNHIREQINLLAVDELMRIESRSASFGGCDVKTIEKGQKVDVDSQPRLAVVQGLGAHVSRHSGPLHHQVCTAYNSCIYKSFRFSWESMY